MRGSTLVSLVWLTASGWLAAAVSTARVDGPRLAAVAPPRRVEVTASRYAFEPARIEAVAGEALELVARSADTGHGLAIKALGVRLALAKGGAPASAIFAPRPGRHVIECSEYCGSGHRRMRGELVVTEAAR